MTFLNINILFITTVNNFYSVIPQFTENAKMHLSFLKKCEIFVFA